MSLPGESTASDREHELARLRVLAEAADAWARWRRQRSHDPASPEEQELLSALDRFESAGVGAGLNLYPRRPAEPD